MTTPEETAAAEKAAAELKAKEEAEKVAAAAQEKRDEFELFLSKQPKKVQDAYEEHTSGLTSALEKERKANKDAKPSLVKLAELEKEEQKRADAQKSELQKAQDRADKAEAESRETKLALMRRDVAAETKLPAELADFLKGETSEEMTASAQILLKSMPKVVAPKLNTTSPGAPQTGETDAERRKRLGLSR